VQNEKYVDLLKKFRVFTYFFLTLKSLRQNFEVGPLVIVRSLVNSILKLVLLHVYGNFFKENSLFQEKKDKNL
jgi:hypothetical protein